MGRLEGKVAIVFGAGPNIGGTIAHFLAREGARIAVSDISADAAHETVEFLTSRGFTAAAFVGNALEEAAVAGAVAGTVARFGHVDVIVNMAGKVHWSSVLDMELAEWREAVLSFPTAGMLTTKHGARAMIAGGRKGSIIHLLSTAAHFGEASGAAYTAAKAALLNLRALGRHGPRPRRHPGQHHHALRHGASVVDQYARGDLRQEFRSAATPQLLLARRLPEDDSARALSARLRSRLGGGVSRRG